MNHYYGSLGFVKSQRFSFWDQLIGFDWGTDAGYRNAQQAYEAFDKILLGFYDKRDWPAGLVNHIREQAAMYATEGRMAPDFWMHIQGNMKKWISDAGYDQTFIPNTDKFMEVIMHYGEGAVQYEYYKKMFTPENVLRVTLTGGDPDPDTSWWDSIPDWAKIGAAGIAAIYLVTTLGTIGKGVAAIIPNKKRK